MTADKANGLADDGPTFSRFGQMPMNPAMHAADTQESASSVAIRSTIPAMPPPPSVAPVPPPNRDRRLFRWALAAIISVLVLTEGIGRIVVWIGHGFRSGTAPAFLTGAALLLLTPAMIFAAVRFFAIGRGGLTPFEMGLRRPTSITDAAILAAAVWFCFLLFAASWVVLTTPKDELARQREVARIDEPVTRPPASQRTPPTTSETASPSAETDATAPDSSDGSSFDLPASDVTTAAADAPAKDDRHVLLKVLGDHPPLRVLILILIATCIAAPIFEELFFRGFLFPAFASRFGAVAGMVLSGALFGLVHVTAVPLRMTVPLGVMGIALAWLRQQTGSLVPGVVVHGFVNALGAGVSAGFGMQTATLIIGTWFVLILLLLPWLRRPLPPATIHSSDPTHDKAGADAHPELLAQ